MEFWNRGKQTNSKKIFFLETDKFMEIMFNILKYASECQIDAIFVIKIFWLLGTKSQKIFPWIYISNSDLNAFYHNLVPRPDLHFLMSSTTPIDYQNDQHQMKGKNTNFNIEYFLKYMWTQNTHYKASWIPHGNVLNQNYPILKIIFPKDISFVFIIFLIHKNVFEIRMKYQSQYLNNRTKIFNFICPC